MTSKTIGQLNGRWAFLLKLALVAVPLMITHQIWLTKGRIDADTHIDTCNQQLIELTTQLKEEVARRTEEIKLMETRFDNLPTPYTKERLDNIDAKVKELDNENAADHRQLITGQERNIVLLQEIKAQITKQGIQ